MRNLEAVPCRLLPLLCSLGVGGLLVGASDGAQSSPPEAAALTRYSHVQEETPYRGPSVDALRRTQTARKVVLRDGRAYRIEHYAPAEATTAHEIILNNGDGQNNQFRYLPAQRRAQLDLPSVQYKFSQKYPEQWRARNHGPVSPPAPPRLRTYGGRAEAERERQLNPTGTLRVGRRAEMVDGKRCTVYTVTFEELRDGRTRRTDPNTRHTQRLWVWEKHDLVLQSDHLTERAGAKPPIPAVTRRVTRITNLNLNPQIDREQFELPAGITCEVFGDYPARLPKGVIPKVIPGSGLVFETPPPPAMR